MAATLGDRLDFRTGDVPPPRSALGLNPVYGANGIIGRTFAHNAHGPLIVVGRVGSFCGSVHYCEGDVWVTDNALICRAHNADETRYWYYAMRNCGLNRFRAGSGQPLLNLNILRSIPVEVADASQRRQIGDLLGALDDKMAANDRVIAAAEGLMTTFVDRITERTRLSRLAQRSAECVQPQELRGTVAHYSFPAFDHDGQPALVDVNTIKSPKFLLTEPCVLFSKLNPRIRRIWNVSRLPIETALASSEFIVLRPIGVDPSVLWAALRQPDVSETLKKVVAGATGSRQRIRPSQLLDVTLPDVRCLDAHSALTIADLGAMCERRRAESAKLAAMRDKLIPLLMSGEIRINSPGSSGRIPKGGMHIGTRYELAAVTV